MKSNLEKSLDHWRLGSAVLALVVGLTVMGLKFLAYRLTGSMALLSDALESVVNVVAAAFALFAVRFSLSPPDKNHPYGHGKIEFVTAVFEGGLISFAALVIIYEAALAYIQHHQPSELGPGLWVSVIAGIVNGALGGFLIFIGRQTQSLTLEADGKHVFTDFLTSIGLIGGLFIVKLTHTYWLDPIIALGLGALLLATGVPLIRHAISGLLDAEEPELLEKIRQGLEEVRDAPIIRAHHIRAMRNGRRIHVDGHIVVPEYWSIKETHDHIERFETRLINALFPEGEAEFHVDPCRRAYCSECEVKECPVREDDFVSRPTLTLEEMVSPIDRTDLPQ